MLSCDVHVFRFSARRSVSHSNPGKMLPPKVIFATSSKGQRFPNEKTDEELLEQKQAKNTKATNILHDFRAAITKPINTKELATCEIADDDYLLKLF